MRGLNLGGDIFRTRPDRPWDPLNLLYNGYRISFTGVKRPGRDVEHPLPSSIGEDKVHPCTGTEAPYRPTAHRGSRGIALLFLENGTRRGEGSASRPGRSLPPGKTRYPLYRRLGWPQGRSGQVRKISPPPGFDPRTVHPAASRYTDYATRPTLPSIAEVKEREELHLVPSGLYLYLLP